MPEVAMVAVRKAAALNFMVLGGGLWELKNDPNRKTTLMNPPDPCLPENSADLLLLAPIFSRARDLLSSLGFARLLRITQ
jgi:hypothetical protein